MYGTLRNSNNSNNISTSVGNLLIQSNDDMSQSMFSLGGGGSSTNNDRLCHCCRKWELPDRSVFSKIFNNESDSALYCHFCMKRVCSIECMYEEKFIIPRLFNIEYDLA